MLGVNAGTVGTPLTRTGALQVRPPSTAVHELDLVVRAAGEVGALVGEVELAGPRIDRRERAGRPRCAAGAPVFGSTSSDAGVLGDDGRALQVRPPSVDRTIPNRRVGDGGGGGVGVLDRVVEVIQRAVRRSATMVLPMVCWNGAVVTMTFGVLQVRPKSRVIDSTVGPVEEQQPSGRETRRSQTW